MLMSGKGKVVFMLHYNLSQNPHVQRCILGMLSEVFSPMFAGNTVETPRRPNFPHPSPLSQTPVSRVLHVKLLMKLIINHLYYLLQ